MNSSEEFTVFVPERSVDLFRSLETSVARGHDATKVVTFRKLEDIWREGANQGRFCIAGELSSSWRQNGCLFDGLQVYSINWPPVFCMLQEPLALREMNMLSSSGVIWAAPREKFLDRQFIDRLLSGSLWRTRYGLVYQKLDRKSVEIGNLLVVLTGEESKLGRIEFSEGNIVAAQYGELSGYEALYAISLVTDWRIDLHTLFIGIEPKTLNSPMFTVVSQLVELADQRHEVLLMGRPPGLTREIPANVMVGLREAIGRADSQFEDVTPGDDEGAVPTSVASSAATLKEFAEDGVGAHDFFFRVPPSKGNQSRALGAAENTSGRATGEEGMNTIGLNEFISTIPGVHGGAVMETDGACVEVVGDFDLETAPIVASSSLEHLAELAKILGIQGLKVACFSGTQQTLFITRQSGAYLFTVGGFVRNAGVVASKIP
mgnify:FL=1